MSAQVITLLSDYGLDNSSVGVIKGILLKSCPGATLIDLTHQVSPRDLMAARFELMTAYQNFPSATVHLSIVNPVTASGSRAVAFRTRDYFFVGPDNGLFDGVLDIEPAIEAVELRTPPVLNRVFRGRDIFAPAAAKLASSQTLSDVGQPIDPQSLVRFAMDLARRKQEIIHGQIQRVDHFGNLITNIPNEWVIEHPWEVRIAGRHFHFSIQTCDLKEGDGKLKAQVASHGFVQVVFEGDNCSRRLGVGEGQMITLHPLTNQYEFVRR
ncbi:MAG: SAM-dependent chlorinase/fluorinase [Gemmatimonadaceae bacterium]|nr:SAM-dependent chlorinase/fluorinase [Gloeobacterales cyanobacterium ES-bin-141]